MLNDKQGGIKNHFWVFGMTQHGIEPRSSKTLANTLTIMPIYRCVYVYEYVRVCVYVCVSEYTYYHSNVFGHPHIVLLFLILKVLMLMKQV